MRPSLSLFAALIALAAAAGATEPAAPPAERAERLLARAERGVEALEGFDAGSSSVKIASCAAAFALKPFVENFKAGSLPIGAGPDVVRELEKDLVLAYTCEAYVLGSPASCKALGSLPSSLDKHMKDWSVVFPLANACEVDWNDAMLTEYKFKGKIDELVALCIERFKIKGTNYFKKETLKESCTIMAGYTGDAKATCRKLKPHYRSAAIHAHSCPEDIGNIFGDARVCGAIAGPPGELCRANAALRPALKAKDISLCRGLPFCRVMMAPSLEECRPYERSVAAQVCAGRYSRASLADDAGAALAGADQALDELKPEGAPEAAALRQRTQALRTRLLKGSP